MQKRESMLKVILLMVLILSMQSGLVQAEEGPEEIVVEELRYSEEGLFEGEELRYGVDSQEYEGLLEAILESVEADVREGLEGLQGTIPTRDSIEMKEWGTFLERYIGKKPTAYPSEAIKIELEDKTLQIRTDRGSKEWISSEILPLMKERIEEASREHAIMEYHLEIDVGTPLTEFEVDVEEMELLEGEKLYPLSGRGEDAQYTMYNTGASYGLMLEKEYVTVLKGYHNESVERYKVEGREYAGSVGVLAYITTPRNLKETEMSEKTIRDFGIYEDLAVNLVTKELVNHKNLSDGGRTDTYKDFRVDEAELLVVPIKGAVVVVQPKFYEGVRIGGFDFVTHSEVDFTGILTGESEGVKVDGVEESLENYMSSQGIIEVYNGVISPFIVYARPESKPYERIIEFAYGPNYDLRYSKDERDKLVEAVQSEMEEQGMESEYKVYMTQVGEGRESVIRKAVPITLIILALGGLVLYRRRKNTEEEIDDILFTDEED